MPLCNGADIGCGGGIDNITGRESELTSCWCSSSRPLEEPMNEAKQMTTAQAVGAVSREAAEWYAIDWPTMNRNVRRLQVRIVQATKESRWGRVRALQRLLTHSYSGKVLAVR
jgi:hypothetical protein